MSEWRDISEAPKDGTKIVLWNPIYDHCPIAAWVEHDCDEGIFYGWQLEGYRSPCCSCEDDFIGYDEDIKDGYMPTLWTPLPLAPTPDHQAQAGSMK